MFSDRNMGLDKDEYLIQFPNGWHHQYKQQGHERSVGLKSWTTLKSAYCLENANTTPCHTNQTTHDQDWLPQYLWELDYGAPVRPLTEPVLNHNSWQSKHKSQTPFTILNQWRCGLNNTLKLLAPANSSPASSHAIQKTRFKNEDSRSTFGSATPPQHFEYTFLNTLGSSDIHL